MSDSVRLEGQPGYVPLSYCVNQALIELEDFSERKRDAFNSFAISGFRELNFTTIESLEVAYLEMDDLNNIKLPRDYQRWIKVGMPVGNRIWNLGVDNSLLLGRGHDCGNDARELFEAEVPLTYTNGYFYTGHWRDGRYVGGLYGAGGGFRKSYFREDKKRGIISFDSPVPRSEIVLEYISDGISAQTMIPKEAINAIVAWIHWRRNIKKDNATRKSFMQDFFDAESSLKSIENEFDITEYLDMMYATTHQSIKR